MARYLTEFIGTFFLVFTIGCSVLNGTPMAPLAIGASLRPMMLTVKNVVAVSASVGLVKSSVTVSRLTSSPVLAAFFQTKRRIVSPRR